MDMDNSLVNVGGYNGPKWLMERNIIKIKSNK